MKNITKFFVALAVVVMGVSCVTDMTEDLGVDIAGQTTLSISLEEATKTQLGEKLNGTYPLCWSEGDQVSLNGVLSNALSASEAGTANAEFVFEGIQTYPYNVLYPASAEGQISFPAEQSYTEGTFAPNAAPMYGYAAAEGANVKLSHLVGALCFAPRGEGVTLTSIVVKSQSGDIAGTYTVDCATGALTAVEGTTSNSVSVSFGENGLALGATATPIYVTVPAGSYGVFSVTLYTATDKMAIYFDSEAKPIVAGTVREFSEFAYEANVEEGDVYFIDSKDALIRFAKIAGNFAPYTTAKLTTNIDLTGVEWNTIENFDAELFDGDGHSIKGLTAPLFGKTSASIKNLTLADINITTTRGVAGALACEITSTKSVVSNCSVSGTFTVEGNNPEENYEASETETAGAMANRYGALIGCSASAQTFSNLSSSATLTVKGTFKYFLCTAGVISHHKGKIEYSTHTGSVTYEGTTASAMDVYITGLANVAGKGFLKCSNGVKDSTAGTITTKGKAGRNAFTTGLSSFGYGTYTDCHNYGALNVSIEAAACHNGGLLRMSNDDALTFYNCTNHGKITLSSKNITARTVVGGLMVNTNSNEDAYFEDCHNYGDIELTSTFNSSSEITGLGGLIGRHYPSAGKTTFVRCENHGNITFNGTVASAFQAGGIAGCTSYSGTSAYQLHLEDVTNYGNLNIGGTMSGNSRIGGILGVSNAISTGGVYVGKIVNKGNITCTTTYKGKQYYVGGIVGACDKEHAGEGYTFINEGDITSTVAVTTTLIAGIAGSTNKKKVANVRCYGNICTSGATNTSMVIGQAKATTGVALTNCHVGGTISTDGGKTVTTLNTENYHQYLYGASTTLARTDISGCGYISAINAAPDYYHGETIKIATADDLVAFAATADSATANAEITADIDMTGVAWSPINGFSQTLYGNNNTIKGLSAPLFDVTGASIRDLNLEVNMDYTTTKGEFGALACEITNAAATISNCSVSGKIILNSTRPTPAHSYPYFGGLVGYSVSTQKLIDLTSSVEFIVKGEHNKQLVIAGIIGYHKGELENCTHLGTIVDNATSTSSTPTIAGIVWNCESSLYNCVNGSAEDQTHTKGSLTINGVSGKNLVIVGIVGYANRVLENCHNYGNININGKVGDSANGEAFIGGILRWNSNTKTTTTLTNCSNHGNITLAADTYNNAYLGGIICENSTNKEFILVNTNNYGKITVNEGVTIGGAALLGGIVARLQQVMNLKLHNSDNFGAIEHKGYTKSNFYAGGVVSYATTNTTVYFYSCKNDGDITIGGTIDGVGRIGGILGFLGKSMGGGSDNIVNNGKISCSAKCNFKPTEETPYALTLGGWLGSSSANVAGTSIKPYNNGDIECTATITDASAIAYIGGMIGFLRPDRYIGNSTVYCTINAPGFKYAGMIVGNHYNEENTMVRNCKIGGKIIVETIYDEGEDNFIPVENIITEANFFKYLYGSPITAEVAAIDTNSCISGNTVIE